MVTIECNEVLSNEACYTGLCCVADVLAFNIAIDYRKGNEDALVWHVQFTDDIRDDGGWYDESRYQITGDKNDIGAPGMRMLTSAGHIVEQIVPSARYFRIVYEAFTSRGVSNFGTVKFTIRKMA